MSADGWKTVRIRVARYAAILARAKSEDISVSAWIDRALDAALSGAGISEPSGREQHLAPDASAPRRAPREPARPAAAAADGYDGSSAGPGHASSAQAKRGVKPILKAKR